MHKKIAKEFLEKYPDRFTVDYEANKRLVAELADIPSKKLKNQIAGCISRMKQIEQRSVVLETAVAT